MDFRSLLRQQMIASESGQDPSQPGGGNVEGDDDGEEEEEDTEYVYCPPTEAQLKVLKARRERSDKIAKRMGECLLLGWRMLDTVCPDCGTILLMPAGSGVDGDGDPTAATTYCIACRELESDVSKDDPAQSAHAAMSQAREAEIAAAAAAAAAASAAASASAASSGAVSSVSSNTLSHDGAVAANAAANASTGSPPEAVLAGLRLTALDRLEFYRQALAVSRDPAETERLLGTLERLLGFLDRVGVVGSGAA